MRDPPKPILHNPCSDEQRPSVSQGLHFISLSCAKTRPAFSRSCSKSNHPTMYVETFEKCQLVRVRSPREKICKARATSALHGIAGRVEIPDEKPDVLQCIVRTNDIGTHDTSKRYRRTDDIAKKISNSCWNFR